MVVTSAKGSNLNFIQTKLPYGDGQSTCLTQTPCCKAFVVIDDVTVAIVSMFLSYESYLNTLSGYCQQINYCLRSSLSGRS